MREIGLLGLELTRISPRENRDSTKSGLKDNLHRWDCAYPGVEILPDGTFVTTTYGHWAEGEQPYVMSIRLKLEELDQLADKQE